MFTVWIGSQNDYSGATEIVIYRDTPDGRRAIAEPMELKFREIGDNEMVEKPTLRLPLHSSSQILGAFAEALDKHGVKTDKDAKISGLMEATKYHLEDMRKLVFK